MLVGMVRDVTRSSACSRNESALQAVAHCSAYAAWMGLQAAQSGLGAGPAITRDLVNKPFMSFVIRRCCRH
jgi:hypothetical protein